MCPRKVTKKEEKSQNGKILRATGISSHLLFNGNVVRSIEYNCNFLSLHSSSEMYLFREIWEEKRLSIEHAATIHNWLRCIVRNTKESEAEWEDKVAVLCWQRYLHFGNCQHFNGMSTAWAKSVSVDIMRTVLKHTQLAKLMTRLMKTAKQRSTIVDYVQPNCRPTAP